MCLAALEQEHHPGGHTSKELDREHVLTMNYSSPGEQRAAIFLFPRLLSVKEGSTLNVTNTEVPMVRQFLWSSCHHWMQTILTRFVKMFCFVEEQETLGVTLLLAVDLEWVVMVLGVQSALLSIIFCVSFHTNHPHQTYPWLIRDSP